MVVYNAERHALLVQGCETLGANVVIGNIPLSQAEAATLDYAIGCEPPGQDGHTEPGARCVSHIDQNKRG